MNSYFDIGKVANKIIVPLDVPTIAAATSIVEQLSKQVGMFKIGLELLMSQGITIVEQITSLGHSVFLDTKLHDIPNTVAGAVRGVVRQNVSMFNVHVSGGFDMMKAAVDAAHEESERLGISCPTVLGVTILTSIDNSVLNEQLRIQGSVRNHVTHMAMLAQDAGLDGVIASPQEISALRQELSDDMLIVTPGIRPKWAASQDQKRVMTPAEAIKLGASYIVVGRPITSPPSIFDSPESAARAIAEEIYDGYRNMEF